MNASATPPLKLLSPAKVNHGLRILSRRDDGYHELQSHMVLLDWGDEMTFARFTATDAAEMIRIRGDFAGVQPRDNLIHRAAMALLDRAQDPWPVEITVQKHVPQGSGLGGGSSNAATALAVLNRCWRCELAYDELLQIGLTLGADVPFFLHARAAEVRGVGERLHSLPAADWHHVLFFPDAAMSTAAVFAHADLPRNQSPLARKALLRPEHWSNACLPVVLQQCPEVARVHGRLAAQHPVHMSGTGSTLYAVFKTVDQAREFAAQNIDLCGIKIAATLPINPLHSFLK